MDRLVFYHDASGLSLYAQFDDASDTTIPFTEGTSSKVRRYKITDATIEAETIAAGRYYPSVREGDYTAPTSSDPILGAFTLDWTGTQGTDQLTGPGADSVTLTIRQNNLPLADADAWVTYDTNSTHLVAGTLQTNSLGKVTFLLTAGETYYLWVQKDGSNPIEGEAFVAVADA